MRRDRWGLRALALAGAALLGAPGADAATLAQVRERGTFNVCAHPDALPYSSQDRTLPGFQLELAEAVARQLGLRLHVDWIVFTRHARRLDCDATLGSVVKLDAEAEAPPRRGPRLTTPYMASGYVLVVPVASPSVRRLEDLDGKKVGVEHSSWPHYVLDTAKVPLTSYGGPLDILEAVTKGEVAAGLVPDAYAGWYIRLNPGTVKVAEAFSRREFQWNVALGLRNADTALVDAVNQALAALAADGTLATILARYGITYRPPIAP